VENAITTDNYVVRGQNVVGTNNSERHWEKMNSMETEDHIHARQIFMPYGSFYTQTFPKPKRSIDKQINITGRLRNATPPCFPLLLCKQYHIIPPQFYILYRANARRTPPIIARPPVAKFETAALVVAVEGALEVELLPDEAAVLVDVVLRVESVTFEAGLDTGARVELVLFDFEVLITVTVDEGIEEVEVLVTTGELLE
jgi:hypothetical protein